MPADSVQQYPTFLLIRCNCYMHYCWCDVTNTHAYSSRVSLTGMCAGSVPHNQTHVMVRMSTVMTWWTHMATVWCNFNSFACGLGTIQSDMPPGPLIIKEKYYSTDAPPSDMLTNTVKFFPYHTTSSLIIGPHLGRHLGYIEMLKDYTVVSLGLFEDNVCITRINKEKSLKSSSRSS